MNKEDRILYFFTATYPYGQRESFIEDEIKFLSSSFKKVVIVPLEGIGAPTRTVPDNCEVLEPIITSKKQQYLIGLLCPLSLKTYLPEFFKKKVFLNSRRLKTWLISYVLSNNLLKSRVIKKLFKEINPDDVCYFYWGKGSNVLAYFYKGKAPFVSRFHGEWDLWEESSGNYAPIRSKIVPSLDTAVLISEKGRNYLQVRYSGCKMTIIPLGSPDFGAGTRSSDGKLRVLSCSSVYGLKRVPLIFESLKTIKDKEIIWTHIGNGVDFEQLREQIRVSCPPNIKVNLLGRKPHPEVFSYYKNNPVDVFVNVSTNEGVPVSIMEALSFNVPVVATNVGSNSEIVTKESGMLISANPSPEEVARAIIELTGKDVKARGFWNNHYNAQKNYGEIVQLLKIVQHG
jgi:glycosyltransferase involved in cell wall biosynthesis